MSTTDTTSLNDELNNRINILHDEIKMGLVECKIPSYMHEGVIMYVLHGTRPGGFLSSVLSNNLILAFSQADGCNKNIVQNYVEFMMMHLPASCYGSNEVFERWVGMGGLEGSWQKI